MKIKPNKLKLEVSTKSSAINKTTTPDSRQPSHTPKTINLQTTKNTITTTPQASPNTNPNPTNNHLKTPKLSNHVLYQPQKTSNINTIQQSHATPAISNPQKPNYPKHQAASQQQNITQP